MDGLISILYIVIFVLIGLIAALAAYYFLVLNRHKVEKKEETTEVINGDSNNKEEKKNQDYGKFTGELTTESILEFMEFEEIVDNMIVRKNGQQYVMILQCNGVNFDLMSEDEKIAVEEGFVQFLNTLRFPIQLYVQSRTLNLKEIIAEYKERVDSLNIEIEKLDAKIEQAKYQGNKPLKEKLEFEKRRKVNILEYGISITDYVDKLSANKNILQQRTYVVVSYYAAEIGGNTEKYSKDELYNMCFSELYTRCQNIASSLASSQITSKILDSEELAELLYIAYNRDEAEFLQLSKALDSQYDALYSTGKDVLQKKQEKLKQEIEIAAIDLATDSILKADKMKKIEDLDAQINKELKIQEKANDLLDTYQKQLEPRVYELAKDQVSKYTQKEETPKLEAKAEQSQESAVQKKKIVKRRKLEN